MLAIPTSHACRAADVTQAVSGETETSEATAQTVLDVQVCSGSAS